MCKACVLLDGLNKGLPKLAIGSNNKTRKIYSVSSSSLAASSSSSSSSLAPPVTDASQSQTERCSGGGGRCGGGGCGGGDGGVKAEPEEEAVEDPCDEGLCDCEDKSVTPSEGDSAGKIASDFAAKTKVLLEI